MPFSSATVSRVFHDQVFDSIVLAQGKIAPSRIERLGFMISSSSTFLKYPSPAHFGQAPWGELKEKVLGSISAKEILSTGQVNFSEYRCSLRSLGYWGISKLLSMISAAIMLPSARFRPCSVDSASLVLSAGKVNLSTTASIECLLVLIKTKSSPISLIWPSTLTCRKPFLARSAKSSRYFTAAYRTMRMADSGKQKP